MSAPLDRWLMRMLWAGFVAVTFEVLVNSLAGLVVGVVVALVTVVNASLLARRDIEREESVYDTPPLPDDWCVEFDAGQAGEAEAVAA